MCYRDVVMLTLFGTVPGPFRDVETRHQLEALPRPRKVTIAWRDRILLLFVFLFLCVWTTFWTKAIIDSWNKRTHWNIFAVSFLLLLLFIWLAQIRRELRNYSLLTDGDVALGRVTSQRTSGGKNKRSVITYEFADSVGRTWNGKGDDSTKKYIENMAVIVFYDPYEPDKNVAVCTTVWRVRISDGKLIDCT